MPRPERHDRIVWDSDTTSLSLPHVSWSLPAGSIPWTAVSGFLRANLIRLSKSSKTRPPSSSANGKKRDAKQKKPSQLFLRHQLRPSNDALDEAGQIKLRSVIMLVLGTFLGGDLAIASTDAEAWCASAAAEKARTDAPNRIWAD